MEIALYGLGGFVVGYFIIGFLFRGPWFNP